MLHLQKISLKGSQRERNAIEIYARRGGSLVPNDISIVIALFPSPGVHNRGK